MEPILFGFKRVTPPIKTKKDIRLDVLFVLVREAGLEPARPE